MEALDFGDEPEYEVRSRDPSDGTDVSVLFSPLTRMWRDPAASSMDREEIPSGAACRVARAAYRREKRRQPCDDSSA
jgi:hypothetical protein